MSLPAAELNHRSSESDDVAADASFRGAHPSVTPAEIVRVKRGEVTVVQDAVAVEEPLEIQLVYGATDARKVKSISITMRTPGNDEELAAGFLMTEGVVRDSTHIARIGTPSAANTAPANATNARQVALPTGLRSQVIRVELSPEVEVSMSTLERNFYTTSSCGVCGKASLLALRTLCPLPQHDHFMIRSDTLSTLPQQLQPVQAAFKQTGGLHAASLFTADGRLQSVREDVGRHNAVDKLLGEAFLQDAVPLRNHLLLLSGRASFELLQKAVMGGIPMVAAIGAPSSLAIDVAREFSITLVGFLRPESFNIYSAPHRVLGPGGTPFHG
ncbi:MAG TPA: formate dehydrogenase accessory sulfurtransferase FdhD [Acidobacteriaceae bacterium]|jgi:FdhD protein|nr:formate dehydrogenase accessory sulfurtransferase FdhD [Acidobacteriaceae bacterium]